MSKVVLSQSNSRNRVILLIISYIYNMLSFEEMKPKRTTEDYIREAIGVHGNKYDYSKTVYAGTKKKLTITCPRHGDFSQEAASHLYNHGCPHCQFGSLPLSEFLEKVKFLFGDKYDFSNIVTPIVSKKISVICNIHGEFITLANDFLNQKGGCPRCRDSIGQQQNTLRSLEKSMVICMIIHVCINLQTSIVAA